MERNVTLPKEITDKIDAMLTAAGVASRTGDHKLSLQQQLNAWQLIPQPKEKWDFYPQTMTVNLIDDYAAIGDLDNVSHWLEMMYKMHFDEQHSGHYTLMVEGETMWKMGKKDRAKYIFDRIFELYGKKGFLGDQLLYYKYIMEQKSRNEINPL